MFCKSNYFSLSVRVGLKLEDFLNNVILGIFGVSVRLNHDKCPTVEPKALYLVTNSDLKLNTNSFLLMVIHVLWLHSVTVNFELLRMTGKFSDYIRIPISSCR